jgi:hypothetical protein
MDHEYFSIGDEAFGMLHHLDLIFVVRWGEGSALLKGEFPKCGNKSW